MRHLIDTTDISVREVDQIIATALDIIENRAKYSEACKGKKLATLFYEPSTRTRLSFTAAMMELGGSVLGFSDAASSSVSKGETVADTVRVLSCFADIIAMRHSIEGAPLVASHYASIPIVNAGDGSHAHPTQTLTDLLTIRRELGRLNNLTIGFCLVVRYTLSSRLCRVMRVSMWCSSLPRSYVCHHISVVRCVTRTTSQPVRLPLWRRLCQSWIYSI